jgi:glutamyl/glutaminyl-tRNA synthetase
MLSNKMLFIWRFKINHDDIITIHDLAHGDVRFEMKNFSDYPITRQDGSFTFIFANFVDDMVMKITHVFRGEDHLSNTANQAALYKVFGATLPIFWHMPIICNIDGKKLSKRDFGFSLRDLQQAGFLPEAIDNYLAILGSSFAQEIMSLQELAQAIDFEKIHTTGAIRYDVEKLRWVNHQWITRYPADQLAQLCKPYLENAYPQATQLDSKKLIQLIETIKTDLITLQDCVSALAFYFTKPVVHKADLQACIAPTLYQIVANMVEQQLNMIGDSKNFVTKLKEESHKQQIPLKELFWFLRLALMDSIKGPAIHDLIDMLGTQEAKKRIEYAIKLLRSL